MRLDAKLHKPRGLNAEIKRLKSVNVSLGGVTVTSEGYTPPTYEGATIVTPTKASQTLETEGYFVKADIKVNPIPNEYIVPEGVKEINKNGTYDITDKKTAEVNVPIPDGYQDTSGVVTDPSKVLSGNAYVDYYGTHYGTMPNNSRIKKTIYYDGESEVIIPEGYHPSGGYVNIEFEDKTVTPTKYSQTVTPGKRMTLGAVTVKPIPDQYIVPSGTKEITENGTHDVNEFQNVNVNVPPTIPEGYIELPTLTDEGTSADMLMGKELIDSEGKVVVGNIPTKTASNLTASGAVVTVPQGYYASEASKSVATATQATPSITVSSGGLITAKATQGAAGYVASGTKSATKQLTTQAAKTVTPTKSSQTAVASQRYTTGAITVAPIPDEYIIPSGTKAITENGTHDVTEFAEVNVNIESGGGGIPEGYYDASGITTPTSDVRKGKEFINKDGKQVGTMKEYVNGSIDHYLTVDAFPSSPDGLFYQIPQGYHDGNSYVQIEPQEKTITPTKSKQEVKPDTEMVLYKVTVNPIPDEYIIPSGELPITANGTYDVTEKASVIVNVEGGGGSSDDGAFAGSIVDRTVTEYINDKATKIGDYALRSCTKLTTVDTPNATSIGQYAFAACSLLANTNFPKVKSVGQYAFNQCNDIRELSFPSCASISTNAFRDAQYVDIIDFPVLESIPANAFYGCRGLKALILRSPTVVPLANTNAFTTCYRILGTKNSGFNPNGEKIGWFYVPRATLSDDDETQDYRRATNWSSDSLVTQFRALEDYTVDGTVTGALDLTKI